MMKKAFTYSLILFLSVFFFYAACGYNFIKYCCSSCEEKGVEVLASTNCTDTHHQSCCETDVDATNSSSEKCAVSDSSTKTCQIIHIKVDEAVFQVIHTTEQLIKSFSSLLYDASYGVCQAANFPFSINKKVPPDTPLQLSGQKILSLICVLRRWFFSTIHVAFLPFGEKEACLMFLREINVWNTKSLFSAQKLL